MIPKSKKKARNQRGQAILEYVLLLVVAVAIAGVIKAFHCNRDNPNDPNSKCTDGVAAWVERLIGAGEDSYYACVLQTGVLQPNSLLCPPKPTLRVNLPAGSSGSTTRSSRTTTGGGNTTNGPPPPSPPPPYKGNTLQPGPTQYPTPTNRDRTGSSSGGGGSFNNSPSGQTYKYNPTNYSSDSLSGSASSSADSAGSASGSAGSTGSASRRKRNKQNASNPQGHLISMNTGGGGGFDNDKNNKKNLDRRRINRKKNKKSIGFREVHLSSKGQPGYAGKRFRAVSSQGYFEEEKERRVRKKPIAASRAGGSKKNQLTGSNKKSQLMQNKIKKKSKEIKDEKWSFGNMFRIILIICVIATLVLLIGGQVTQVKKSMK